MLDEEEYINFTLLENELQEFSKLEELSSFIDISDETVIRNSSEVSRYLEEVNQISPEEQAKMEEERRQNDRDFLYKALKGTGITDIDELRAIYEKQQNVRVSNEDLEEVLASITGEDSTQRTVLDSGIEATEGIVKTDDLHSCEKIPQMIEEKEEVEKGIKK